MKNLIKWASLALSLLILTACETSDQRTRLDSFVKATANNAIRELGTPYLNEKAPFLVPILDTDKDGKVSLEEVEAVIESGENPLIAKFVVELLTAQGKPEAAPPTEGS